MSLIDMTLSAEEAKEQMGCDPGDAPKYPWGLEISLDDETLAKLGITVLPAPGTKLQITAICEVCATSQRKSQNGEDESSVSLQITAMEVGNAMVASTPAGQSSALYGA